MSSYDRIQANRALNRSYAEFHEQRSAARQEAAQRTMSRGQAVRNNMLSTVADIGAGTTKLTEMMIRTRVAAEAKVKMDAMAKKYA